MKNMFDEYVPLFGMKGDDRIRYMIHKYNEEYNKTTPSGSRYNYSPFPTGELPSFIKDLTSPESTKEWKVLFNNIYCFNNHVLNGNEDVFKTYIGNYKPVNPTFTIVKAVELRKYLLKKLELDCRRNNNYRIIKKILNTLYKCGTTPFIDDSEAISSSAHTTNWTMNASLYAWDIDDCTEKYVKKDFSYYKYEEYIADKITEESRLSPRSKPLSSIFDSKENELEEQIYYRKELNGDIYNSSKIPNTLESVADLAKKGNHAVCHDAINADGTDCATYLRDCLVGKNITECKNFFGKKDFWIKTKEQIRNMNPELALQTLKAFGFKKTEQYDDTAKRVLYKVIPVDMWLNEINKLIETGEISSDEYNNIVKNDKLLNYLNMVVLKVNANPTILNPEYLGSCAEQTPGIPSYVSSNNRFTSMGIPLTPRRKHSFQFEGLRSALEPRFIVRTGMPFYSKMYGGGVGNVEDKIKMRKYAHDVLIRQYYNLIQSLKVHGKYISENDSLKINELFDQLLKSEEKLSNVISYIEKYSNLVNTQTPSKEIVSLDNIQQILNKQNVYFTRVGKQQNNLLSIMQSILLALSDNTTKLPRAPSPPVVPNSTLLPL